MAGIYVEIEIQCPMDDLWERTQSPKVHRRWDLRFTDIEYLHRSASSQPQRFLYETRIGFGLRIAGEGETLGTHENGARTSALKFWSNDLKSLIREGSGYWQYIPTLNGIRFLTWYDYSTRFGVIGRVFDAAVFRPLLGWATAWSFDRLRLWLEKQIDPAISLRQSVIYTVGRVTVAFIWIYHGLIPKLLWKSADELAMLKAAGVESGGILRAVGVSEILFGLALLVFWRSRALLVVTGVTMTAALIVIGVTSAAYFTAAFNPVTLNVAMIALCAIGLLSGRDLPSARNCRRRKPEAREARAR
jgi:uncharacterized membrane protein YphA (DoxX/SURF4 family)